MEPKNIVKTTAIIILILSVLGLFGNFFYMLIYFIPILSSIFTEVLSQSGYTLSELAVTSFFSFILGIPLVIGSIGLLTYKKWARKFTIVSIILTLLMGLTSLTYTIATGKPFIASIIGYFFSLIIWGLFIHFLSKEKVKKFLHGIK